MGKIVAIGGGEIGRPGFEIETLDIDMEIIKLSKSKNPKLLFIPTASFDSQGYVDVVNKYFGEKLQCKIDVLLLLNNTLSKKEIESKILGADIIYVGGGNTLEMMKTWEKFNVDKFLLKAYKKGIILSGVSAGSICWFNSGSSDSLKTSTNNAPLIKVFGLNLIKALHSPHYDMEKNRRGELKEMMKNTPGVAIAIDNCCALEIIDDKYRIITSKVTANAYKVYWDKGKFYENIIDKKDTFESVNKLTKKD